jgi:hypothetical protein
VRTAVEAGDFIDMVHASERQAKRQVTRPEYVYVLRTGNHEKRKDEFKEEHQAWNYAIRGKTLDGRTLRVPVSFTEEGTLLVITVIDLDEDDP